MKIPENFSDFLRVGWVQHPTEGEIALALYRGGPDELLHGCVAAVRALTKITTDPRIAGALNKLVSASWLDWPAPERVAAAPPPDFVYFDGSRFVVEMCLLFSGPEKPSPDAVAGVLSRALAAHLEAIMPGTDVVPHVVKMPREPS